MSHKFALSLKMTGIAALGFISLSACSSISMPKVDLMGGSAFDEDVQNIDSSIPSVDEAPAMPTDVRSDEAWDQDANALILVRDGFSVPDKEYEQPSEAALKATYQELKEQAQAYKADDPK